MLIHISQVYPMHMLHFQGIAFIQMIFTLLYSSSHQAIMALLLNPLHGPHPINCSSSHNLYIKKQNWQKCIGQFIFDINGKILGVTKFVVLS
mmetsp:Transcript_10156/g.13861  ORF Transcript_10156/g.13861 Transcript_10156/m.13861 type:complete len:92 (-) Transcript_10156:1746-2021(-)